MSLARKKNLSLQELAILTELYESALKLEGEARKTFIERETKGLPWLQDEIEGFLGKEIEIDQYLEKPILAELTPAPSRARFPDYAPDTVVNEFKIIRVLGRGGLATVYLARHIPLDRVVALKVCEPEGAEARMLAHLEHDHIVKVFSESLDLERNLRLISMPVVSGASLDEVLNRLKDRKKSTLSGADWLEIIDELACIPAVLDPSALKYRAFFHSMSHLEICVWMAGRLADALAYAHEREILHLDVKPSNILISQYGRPFLTDFNVALDKRNRGSLSLGGTRNFMAPEQVRLLDYKPTEEAIANLGPCTDIFSLTLTIGTAISVGVEKPDDLLDALLHRASAPDPKHRYSSAAEFSRALKSYLEIRSVKGALPPSTLLARLAGRFPLSVLMLVGALPQVVASIVCHRYNAIYIVGRLTPKQLQVFMFLGKTYLPIVFVFSTLLWLLKVYPIFRYLRSRKTENINLLRAKVVALPEWALLFTTLGWIPAGIFFPLTIHLASGGLTFSALGHFAVVFILGWALSLSYSILMNYYVMLRFIYPRFFEGCTRIREIARTEVRPFARWVGILQALTILVPMVAVGILLITPGLGDQTTFEATRSLALSLLALSAFGVLFALHATRRVNDTIVSLTRAKTE